MSIYSFAKAVARSNLPGQTRPFKLNYCLTYNCQSRCQTCNIWQMRPKNELSLEEVTKFASRNRYFQWVQLTGGEPFLRPDLSLIARWFLHYSKPYLINIPTNCLCPPEKVKTQVEQILHNQNLKNLIITPSIDGHEELHDHIRGIVGNHRRVLDTVAHLLTIRDKRLRIVFSYTMSRYNQGALQETIESVTDPFPGFVEGDFHINLAQNSGNYYHNQAQSITPDRDSALQELSWMRKQEHHGWQGFLEKWFLKNLVQYLKTGKSPVESKELLSSCYMDSWGDVYPSVMWDQKIGSIRSVDYDLMRIWNSDRAVEARRMVKMGASPQHWTSCEAYQTMLGHLLH